MADGPIEPFTPEERIRGGAAMGVAAGGILAVVVIWLVAFVALPVTVVARLLHLQRWTVVAQKRTPVSREHRWTVTGWKMSTEVLTEVRSCLREGHRLPG